MVAIKKVDGELIFRHAEKSKSAKGKTLTKSLHINF